MQQAVVRRARLSLPVPSLSRWSKPSASTMSAKLISSFDAKEKGSAAPSRYAPRRAGRAFQTLVRREDAPALPFLYVQHIVVRRAQLSLPKPSASTRCLSPQPNQNAGCNAWGPTTHARRPHHQRANRVRSVDRASLASLVSRSCWPIDNNP